MSKLPDKGQRIQALYDRVVKEIGTRDEVSKAAELFSDLNIVAKGIAAVTHMEWTGGKGKPDDAVNVLDSDDDEAETDPLKLLAQSRSNVKLIKIEKPEKLLITDEDLKEIKSFENEPSSEKESDQTSVNSSNELDPHALNMCRINSKSEIGKKKIFFAHKTTKSDVHAVDQEKSRKLSKHWEVTAATPPILRNSATQLLTLQDSIEIQRKQQEEHKVGYHFWGSFRLC